MRHKTLSACLETCRGVHLLISKGGMSCLGFFWPVQGQHKKNKTPSNILSTNTVVMVSFAGFSFLNVKICCFGLFFFFFKSKCLSCSLQRLLD